MNLLLALLLPTALASLLWIALLGRPRGVAAWAACIGASYLVGAIAFGVALRWAVALPVHDWFATIAPALGLLCLAAAGGLVWGRKHLRVVAAPAVHGPRERLLLGLLAGLLLAHLAFLSVQAIAQPTLAWDAWAAWMAKPKAWLGADRMLPGVEFEAWWRAEPGTALYALAGHYPDSLPRFVAWIAGADGGWSEPAAHSAWPLLWLALAAMLFGYLRLAGARPPLAALACFTVMSLPLVNAHVALAGYADLWLAGMVLLAVVHGLRAFGERSWRDAVFALGCALLLPAIKLEGAVWLLCLLLAGALAALPRRIQLAAVVGAVVVGLASLPFGGLPVPLPGLGTVHVAWGSIAIPAMGTLQLYWRPVVEEVLLSLFVLPNWHLLWIVLPIAVVLARGQLLERSRVMFPGLYFLVLGYAFLFVLFFFTDASAWAENLTSVNRVLLQIVPATVFWVALLAIRPPAVRGRWS